MPNATASPASTGTLAERRLALLRRELELRHRLDERAASVDKPWVCDRDDCDGLEHESFPYRHARTAQRAPTDPHLLWILLQGRGAGKTRTGAETLVQRVLDTPTAPDGSATEWAIVAETFGDARAVCVEGPSGVRSVLNRRGVAYTYNRSLWQIRLPAGQMIHMLGADDADVGRGLNLSGAWLDEICKWRYARASWTEGLAPALRIGTPQVIVTTTPKPSLLLKDWLDRTDGSVIVTRGSTFDNAANLSQTAIDELKKRYEGTRLGRQELYGEYLDDNPGALWTRANIDAARRTPAQLADAGDLVRVVVAVDPAATSGEDADLTGIVVAGRDGAGHFWVLDDRSQRATPDGWARVVIDAYHAHKANAVVAEVNNGGEMVGTVIHHVERVPYKAVTATRGKRLRAEPISLLYETGRVHHVGSFPDLEDQLVNWTPDADYSPDRLDACVWALTDLANVAGFDSFMAAALAESLEDRAREAKERAMEQAKAAASAGIDGFMAQLTRQ